MLYFTESLTSATIADNAVQHGDKIRDDMVDFIESREHGDDVGTGICISLFQNAGQKDRQGLVKAFRQD